MSFSSYYSSLSRASLVPSITSLALPLLHSPVFLFSPITIPSLSSISLPLIVSFPLFSSFSPSPHPVHFSSRHAISLHLSSILCFSCLYILPSSLLYFILSLSFSYSPFLTPPLTHYVNLFPQYSFFLLHLFHPFHTSCYFASLLPPSLPCPWWCIPRCIPASVSPPLPLNNTGSALLWAPPFPCAGQCSHFLVFHMCKGDSRWSTLYLYPITDLYAVVLKYK